MYDFIIIGGSLSGFACAATLRQYSHSVAVIDNVYNLGSCMPTQGIDWHSSKVIKTKKKLGHWKVYTESKMFDTRSLIYACSPCTVKSTVDVWHIKPLANVLIKYFCKNKDQWSSLIPLLIESGSLHVDTSEFLGNGYDSGVQTAHRAMNRSSIIDYLCFCCMFTVFCIAVVSVHFPAASVSMIFLLPFVVVFGLLGMNKSMNDFSAGQLLRNQCTE